MRIYTRTGDRGMTSLKGGVKVPKTDLRIETNGNIDELNSILGLLRMELDELGLKDMSLFIGKVQSDLMSIMSNIINPDLVKNKESGRIREIGVNDIESKIDEIQESGVLTQHFVLPSGCRGGALAHISRTVCRRAERALWRMNEQYEVEEEVMFYFNRLSDYLFAIARYVNFNAGFQNEIWAPFKSATV